MLERVKVALGVTAPELDGVIQDMIDAARSDLVLSGVRAEKAADDADPLIRRAVITYCKAHLGYANPDADRFERAYMLLKQHLSLSGDYGVGGEE